MTEVSLDEIEKIVQHTAKTITHDTAPRTLELINDLQGSIGAIHKILEGQNESTGAFHDKMNAHIQRVEPVINAYEEEKRFRESVGKVGERVIWWSKVLGAIGVIAVTIKYALFNSIKL